MISCQVRRSASRISAKARISGKALAPACFLVAGLALGDVGLFPSGDRQSFVVAHLVVHAGAIFQHHVSRRVALVVADTLINPFDVVGGGGSGGVGGKANGGECERVNGGFHWNPPESACR